MTDKFSCTFKDPLGARKKIDILSFSFAIGSAGGKINFKSASYQIAQKVKKIKGKKGNKIKILFFTEVLRETVDRMPNSRKGVDKTLKVANCRSDLQLIGCGQ
jgi:hypothetical protein